MKFFPPKWNFFPPKGNFFLRKGYFSIKWNFFLLDGISALWLQYVLIPRICFLTTSRYITQNLLFGYNTSQYLESAFWLYHVSIPRICFLAASHYITGPSSTISRGIFCWDNFVYTQHKWLCRGYPNMNNVRINNHFTQCVSFCYPTKKIN